MPRIRPLIEPPHSLILYLIINYRSLLYYLKCSIIKIHKPNPICDLKSEKLRNKGEVDLT